MKVLEKNCTIFGRILMSYYCISWPASSTAVAVMNCSVMNEPSCELGSFVCLAQCCRLPLASTGTAVLCIYSCLNVTHLQVVTLECRVCCQVELFIKVLIIDVYIDLYMLLLIRNS